MFIYGRVEESDNPYFSQFELETIDLQSPGQYDFSFYVFMYCYGSFCSLTDTLDDSFKVIINEFHGRPEAYTINFSNSGRTKIWQKNTFRFTTNTRDIDVKMAFYYPPPFFFNLFKPLFKQFK